VNLIKTEHNKLSDLAYYCLAVILAFLVVVFPPHNVLAYDVFGYYMYLPFQFKYHDITIKNYETVDHILRTYYASDTFYQGVKWDNGNYVMRYPIGLSVFYAPFYFIGDLIAPHTSYKADGFSRPYQLSVMYGCLLYSLVGLYYVKKILLRFFSDGVSAFTLIVLGLGTNYFFHSSIHGQGAMSHNILFSVYVIILYLTIRWHETFNVKHMIFLGIAIGLAALSRASEILSLIIPLVYGITSVKGVKEKFHLLLKHKLQIILFATILIAIGFIQFGYWKYAAGKFFVNPYGSSNPGEGLELGHPHILEVLFSFRKGWFLYTPIMLFAMFGFWVMYKKNKVLFTCIFVFFIVNLYVVSSWSCWWYGSCFGNRALIPSYGVLFIPLAYGFDHVLSHRFKYLFIKLIFVLVGLNLFQSWQVSEWILDSTNVSRAYYFSTFLQTNHPNQAQTDLLLVGKFDTGVELFKKKDSLTHVLGFKKVIDFENGAIDKRCLSTTLHKSGKNGLIMSNKTVPSCSVQVAFNEITEKSYTWIKASVWVYSFYPVRDWDAIFGIHMKHKGYIFKLKNYKLFETNLKPGQWTKLEYYYLVPDDLRSKKDKICIYVVNNNEDAIVIDDLSLESYEPIIDQSYF
jgi:hypothetical protein